MLPSLESESESGSKLKSKSGSKSTSESETLCFKPKYRIIGQIEFTMFFLFSSFSYFYHFSSCKDQFTCFNFKIWVSLDLG